MGRLAPRQRRLVLVCGDEAACERWVADRLPPGQRPQVLWVADGSADFASALPARHFGKILGREFALVVFNAHQGFHPDAFAAAAGTLRGGGDCIVLAPPLDQWRDFDDPDKARFACYPNTAGDMRGLFVQRLVALWRADPTVAILDPLSAEPLRLAPSPPAGFTLTDEQQDLLPVIERVALGHARRPVVLSADRGRGKSTLLGIAAAGLLQKGVARVTVVAATRAAVQTLFRHAARALGSDETRVRDIHCGDSILRFRLPCEHLDDHPAERGVVFVDEAAALPLGVLQRLLDHDNRLVFATTVHGYEGSGRGFDLRFTRMLDQAMPQWRRLHLQQPVRWAEGDPLERLLARSLLLDADPGDVPQQGPLEIRQLDAARLAEDEDCLRAVFGLLIAAHYQTRPSDLRQLLDNPELSIWVAVRRGVVIGVALAASEGGLDPAIAAQIIAGERRPRGHLLPQSLAVHAGVDEILQQRVLRVQRIVVHPGLQRSGIGRRLVLSMEASARAHGCDHLGCAFAGDPGMLDFWQACGFAVVRVGLRVDPAGAAPSLFMLNPLSGGGAELVEDVRRRFQAALPWSLARGLRHLDSQLAVRLLAGRDNRDLLLDARDRRDLARLAGGMRQVATAEHLVWKALLELASRPLDATVDLAPLVAWQLQHRAVATVCRSFGLAGRRALEARLRAALAAF